MYRYVFDTNTRLSIYQRLFHGCTADVEHDRFNVNFWESYLDVLASRKSVVRAQVFIPVAPAVRGAQIQVLNGFCIVAAACWRRSRLEAHVSSRGHQASALLFGRTRLKRIPCTRVPTPVTTCSRAIPEKPPVVVVNERRQYSLENSRRRSEPIIRLSLYLPHVLFCCSYILFFHFRSF